MKVDFFDSNCQTITQAPLFGLCDLGDKTPAFVDLMTIKGGLLQL